MRTRFVSIGLVTTLIALSLCICGCSSQTGSNPETTPYEYEGLQLLLPDGWSVEGNGSVRISSEDTDGAIALVSSGKFPNAVLNSDIGKILSMQELVKSLESSLNMSSELNVSVVQDHPICRATSVTSNDGESLYSFYGFCFDDHAIAMVANNIEDPSIAFILSSYSFTEPCSKALVLTASDMAAGDAPRMDYKGQYEPEIGMSQEDVLLSSWGEPTEKNTTKTASDTNEQWIYPHGRYIYFKDGVVSTIQE